MKTISNKKRGSDFENQIVETMADLGCWARKMYPDERGRQPFDVLALGREYVYAYDGKTCCRPVFPLSRVEDDQWTGFESIWRKADITVVGVLALYDGHVYFIPYEHLLTVLHHGGKEVHLSESNLWEFDHAFQNHR